MTDGVFQRLEKCVVMLGRGMTVQQATDAILQDIETHFVSAGLLDDTPQQKPGLRVRIDIQLSCLYASLYRHDLNCFGLCSCSTVVIPTAAIIDDCVAQLSCCQKPMQMLNLSQQDNDCLAVQHAKASSSCKDVQ